MNRQAIVMPQQNDADRDALHILPLSIIPLETPALKRVRMVKNARMESMVEVFSGKDIGSGQVAMDRLSTVFPNIAAHDYTTLASLSRLQSYDVFSLRIMLKNCGVKIEDESDLTLSPGLRGKLGAYMARFIRPLLNNVFGQETADTDSLTALLAHPDPAQVIGNLRRISQKLGIALDEVPQFLEDYGDVFLSVSYYQHCLDRIAPTIAEFRECVSQIKNNRMFQGSQQALRTCTQVEGTVQRWTNAVVMRFRGFEQGCDALWLNLDATQFDKFRNAIQGSHTSLGATLCALTVKMDSWSREFPDRNLGGPLKRVDFIVNEMRQGLALH